MKKFLTLSFLVSMMFLGFQKAEAMKYEDAIAQSKPAAILIYAPWADGAQAALQAFNAMGQNYPNYNFVTMNIATDEAKAFNKVYHIYPNLPYVLLFKDRGKISRYLKQDCVMDSSCFSQKLDFFQN